jgi:class 3 adenylate cyclase
MSVEPASQTLTFLFTDLEGSTRLWEQHQQPMKEALERHDRILREAVESVNGKVVKSTGDGLMAVFYSALDGERLPESPARPRAIMKHELRQMRKQGTGAIVNCSSFGGLVGPPGRASYHASKHGVIGLTKSAALEYAPRGVRINAVCLGGELDTSEAIKNQPIGRLGRADEIAAAVLWLCSPAASFVIGVALPVDGGYTCPRGRERGRWTGHAQPGVPCCERSDGNRPRRRPAGPIVAISHPPPRGRIPVRHRYRPPQPALLTRPTAHRRRIVVAMPPCCFSTSRNDHPRGQTTAHSRLRNEANR